mmetsp:Transcript_451/g.1458  ORF Transcript_451/g.1458 Transcript_451/m.1458 type:complete len:352 (-) Transcript_451:626-1681(-)
MRVGCAAIGVLGVLLRRRRRIAAVVDARLQREHVDHAPHSLRRRHQPVDAAKPLGQLLLERFDPRRVGSASLHLASVPAAALDGFGRSPGVAFLVVPIVGDRLELRLLVHLIARGQPKRMLCGPFTASAFEDGPAAFAQLRPLVRRTTPLGVLLVERLRHWLEGSACRRHGIVGAVLAIERLGKPRSALAHICFVHHALLLLQLRLCLSVLDVRTLPPPLTHWVLHLGRARRIPQRHVCAQRLAERSLVRGLVRLQRHRDRHLHCRRHRRLHTPTHQSFGLSSRAICRGRRTSTITWWARAWSPQQASTTSRATRGRTRLALRRKLRRSRLSVGTSRCRLAWRRRVRPSRA